MDVVHLRTVQLPDRPRLFGNPDGVDDEDAAGTLLRHLFNEPRERRGQPLPAAFPVERIAGPLQGMSGLARAGLGDGDEFAGPDDRGAVLRRDLLRQAGFS